MLFILDNPSNFGDIHYRDPNNFTFSAPPGTRLAPNTKYWIQIYTVYANIVSQDGVMRVSTSNSNETGLADWSIGDTSRGVNNLVNFITTFSSIQMRIEGVVFSPKRTESAAWDFPYSDETLGFVDVMRSSTGRLDATLDSGRRTGDWWKLHVDPHRRYRVEVEFGSGSNHARGGGIDVNYDAALWDHNRDDGRAFVEFTAQWESYHLRVRARDFLNEGSASFYGNYSVSLTDITGITLKVSNGNAYSGSKTEVSNTLWKATLFTTGSNTGGYKLSYVGTGLHNKVGANSVKAELWTGNSSGPGTKIFDFNRAGAITGHPTAQYSDRFWAPASAPNLAAATTYWVVFKEENSGSTYEVTRADTGTDNPGAASGWSYPELLLPIHHHRGTSPAWTVAHFPGPIVLDVYASNVGASNASEAVDQTAPQLRSATVDGYTLTLAYDEPLHETAMPPGSAFTVNVDGSPRPVMVVAVGQSNVLLFLSAPVEAGDAVTVDYTVPTDEEAGRVRDTSGNAAGSFNGQAATNDTTSSGGGGGGSDEQDPPGVPESLDVALQQSGKLKATWKAPGSGPAPTGYTVQWRAAR